MLEADHPQGFPCGRYSGPDCWDLARTKTNLLARRYDGIAVYANLRESDGTIASGDNI